MLHNCRKNEYAEGRHIGGIVVRCSIQHIECRVTISAHFFQSSGLFRRWYMVPSVHGSLLYLSASLANRLSDLLDPNHEHMRDLLYPSRYTFSHSSLPRHLLTSCSFLHSAAGSHNRYYGTDVFTTGKHWSNNDRFSSLTSLRPSWAVHRGIVWWSTTGRPSLGLFSPREIQYHFIFHANSCGIFCSAQSSKGCRIYRFLYIVEIWICNHMLLLFYNYFFCSQIKSISSNLLIERLIKLTREFSRH